MGRRYLNIFMCDNNEDESLDKYLDGSLISEGTFDTLTLSDKTFNNRTNADEYKKLVNKLKDDLAISCEIEPDLDSSNDLKFISSLENLNANEFFDSFNAIRFIDGNLDFIKETIQNNFEFFKNKKIILTDTYDMFSESREKMFKDIKVLNELVGGFTPEVLVMVKGNILPISVSEYESSYEKIQSIVDLVNSLNLSQAEKIMFVYDLVKKRVFNEEKELENAHESRDFTSSFLGDKIVCVGFNIIFDTILNLLGIEANSCNLKGKEDDGHVRSIIYVDDPKYNILGHYFFDVTWDSKKNDKSSNSYVFFMKTLNEMINADRDASLIFEEDTYLYPNFYYRVFKELSSTFSYSDFIAIGGKTRFNRYLNHLGENLKINLDCSNSKQELLSAYKLIYDSFNNTIDSKTFANLLYNVKRIEYYLEPDVTPFSEEDLASSIISYSFSKYSSNETEVNILTRILGLSESEILAMRKKDTLKSTITPELKANIRKVKLTRTLRESLLRK